MKARDKIIGRAIQVTATVGWTGGFVATIHYGQWVAVGLLLVIAAMWKLQLMLATKIMRAKRAHDELRRYTLELVRMSLPLAANAIRNSDAPDADKANLTARGDQLDAEFREMLRQMDEPS